jgi:uncharacterized protein (TIGR02246 family)
MSGVVCVKDFEPTGVAGMALDLEAEQAALERFMGRYTDAWNRNDAAALAATFLPTGDLLNSRGRMATGHAEVERLLGGEFSTVMRGSRASIRVTHLRFLSPVTVHADSELVVEGAHKPDGTEMPPVRMHVAWVARKDERGEWGFLTVRPYALVASL